MEWTMITESLSVVTAILLLIHASGKTFKAPLAVATGQSFGYARVILPLGIFEFALSIALIVVVAGYLSPSVGLIASTWFVISMGAAAAHHLLVQGFSAGWRAALIPTVFTLIGVATFVSLL